MTGGPTKMVWVYVDTNYYVGHPDHLKVFAIPDAADEWFKENDPEGVVFGLRDHRMTDQALLISTLREAGRIIGEYIEPGPRDAEKTLTRLIGVLETQDLARAIERIERGHRLRVVK